MQPEQDIAEHYLRLRILLQEVGGVMASYQGDTVWHLGDMVLDHDASLVGRNSDMAAQDNQPWGGVGWNKVTGLKIRLPGSIFIETMDCEVAVGHSNVLILTERRHMITICFM
jgi:hypothetical protein